MSENLGINAERYLKIGKLFDKLMDMDWEPSSDCHVWFYYSSRERSLHVEADFGNECVEIMEGAEVVESFDFDSDTLVKDVIQCVDKLM